MMEMDQLRLFDVGAAHAVFGVLARLYGADGADQWVPLQATIHLAPEAAVLEAQQAAEREAARLLLDRLPFGIIVIDGRRRVQLANEAAEHILEEGSFLRCDGDVLGAATREDEPHLDALVERAQTRVPWPAQGITLLLQRTGARRPVRILSLALAGPDPTDSGLVLLLPDDARTHAVRRLLATLFGLTPAEAHIAVLMTGGLTLAEAAGERGITINTARTQWQTVIWKVGGGADAPLLALLRSALTLPIRAGADR
jgi:PAS domain-containing protein